MPSLARVRHGRMSLLGLALLSTGLLVGCGDDLYDSGTCQVSELPSGQAKVECENGDALIIGDVVADGTCQLMEGADGSKTLRCDGADYVIPAPTGPAAESYRCQIGETNGAETVDCETLIRPMPSCPNGLSGVMILGAHDDEGDGGDGEGGDDGRWERGAAKDTFLRYGCTAFSGRIIVTGSLSQSDRETLSRIESLTGALAVTGFKDSTLALENLRDGTPGIELYDNENLTALHLPQLLRAESFDIGLQEALETVDAPLLQSTSSYVRLNHLPSIQTISFPALVYAESLEFFGLGDRLTSLHFPVLEEARLSFYETYIPSDVSFPALQKSENLNMFNNDFTGNLTFPALTELGELDMLVSSGAFSIDFPLLRTVGRVEIVQNEGLTALTMPALEEVLESRDFRIRENHQLESIHFPALATIDGGIFSLENNESLTSVRLESLAQAAGVQIYDHAALATLALPALLTVTDSLWIRDNAVLDQCIVNDIYDALDSSAFDASFQLEVGDNDIALCQAP